ncbi:MAG: thymidine kinase [Natronospirillum sp.]
MAQLYFYYSAMNAGKSTSLLQNAHNYRERGLAPVLFTAAIDERYGRGRIASRIGLAADAELFDGDTDFVAWVQAQQADKTLHCILIDEAQFLSVVQVDQLAAVVDDLNVPVVCYGLRTDFMGQLFPGSSRLLAIADKLSELKAICHCGRKATMTVRLSGDGLVQQSGEQVVIGDNDVYVSLCRAHHRAALAGDHSAAKPALAKE